MIFQPGETVHVLTPASYPDYQKYTVIDGMGPAGAEDYVKVSYLDSLGVCRKLWISLASLAISKSRIYRPDQAPLQFNIGDMVRIRSGGWPDFQITGIRFNPDPENPTYCGNDPWAIAGWRAENLVAVEDKSSIEKCNVQSPCSDSVGGVPYIGHSVSVPRAGCITITGGKGGATTDNGGSVIIAGGSGGWTTNPEPAKDWSERIDQRESFDDLEYELTEAHEENRILKEQIESIDQAHQRTIEYSEKLQLQLKENLYQLEIAQAANHLLKKPTTIEIGCKIWSKSTGLGPYIILGEALQTIGPPQTPGKVPSYICRSTAGIDHLVPVDDATLTAKPFGLLCYLLHCLVYYLSLKKIK